MSVEDRSHRPAAPGTRPSAKAGMSLEELRALIEKTSFAKRLGAEVTKYGEGEVELTIPVTAEITQHHGFVHGTVVAFMADSACAWAAASVAGDVVTSEYKINLIAPAVGARLIGRGHVVKALSRQVVCRADVFVEKGGEERVVATALATIAKMSV
jgi:uncharacterized protein (TIGR00369 family)